MSVLPAFVNAIFKLQSMGSFTLYEGPIPNGTTKVFITQNNYSGYNGTFYKVNQIIALEGMKAVKQSFDIPSIEFAFRMIERAIIEQQLEGENNEIPVEISKQSGNNNSGVNRTGTTEPLSLYSGQKRSSSNSIPVSYKPVITSQSEQLGQKGARRVADPLQSSSVSFSEINQFAGDLGSIDGSEIKIANMSSFTSNGQSSVGNRNKGFEGFESILDSGL